MKIKFNSEYINNINKIQSTESTDKTLNTFSSVKTIYQSVYRVPTSF